MNEVVVTQTGKRLEDTVNVFVFLQTETKKILLCKLWVYPNREVAYRYFNRELEKERP